MAGCTPDLVADVKVGLGQMELQVRQDTDGEDRIIHAEGALDLDIKLYANREMEILEDIFSPEKELEIYRREELYETMVMRNSSRLRAGGEEFGQRAQNPAFSRYAAAREPLKWMRCGWRRGE